RIRRQCAGSNSPFKLLVRFRTSSDGGRLSPHPSGNVPVQIRLSNCLRITDSLCTAGGFSRTLPAMCRSEFAFQTDCVSPTTCVQQAALAAPI
ncbi:hypothetical protein PZH37_16930, partial [[Eubacterium] siraeum]|nr:hypothetical protein [[Eubacterium] siraeum]